MLCSFFPRRARCALSIFIILCVLVSFDATQDLDYWIFSLANTVSSKSLDLASSFVTLLGNFEITGAFTFIYSIFAWKHRGIRGLAPMLLFLGVAIEVVLKFALPHPDLPKGYGRNVEILPPIRFSTPYSFPSGHLLRATFLAIYFTPNKGLWRATGWLFILAMALTRVYLNEHWTSDIIGGVFLGLAFAYVAKAIDRRAAPPQT